MARLVVVIILSLYSNTGISLRCYTDLQATKSLSVECGLNTACIKIYKKPEGFDSAGYFIPVHRRGPDIQLFRGCFLVKTFDTCYDSLTNKLSYCWCHEDLCNQGLKISLSWGFVVIVLIFRS